MEDYEDARDMYRDYLDFAGFDVHTADNGEEGIEIARALQPDLILMDLSLPVLDGWEATCRLKQEPETASIKVIALSAHAMAAEQRRAIAVGCDGFIAKPCVPEQLVQLMSRYLPASLPLAPRRKTASQSQ